MLWETARNATEQAGFVAMILSKAWGGPASANVGPEFYAASDAVEAVQTAEHAMIESACSRRGGP